MVKKVLKTIGDYIMYFLDSPRVDLTILNFVVGKNVRFQKRKKKFRRTIQYDRKK